MSHTKVTRPETETETDEPLRTVNGQYRGKNEAPADGGAGRFMRDVWQALTDLVMADRRNAGLVPADAEGRYRSALLTELRREFTYRAAALKDAEPTLTAAALAHALRGHATSDTISEQLEYERISKAWRALDERDDVPGSYAKFKQMLAEPKPPAEVRQAGLAAVRAALPEPQEAS